MFRIFRQVRKVDNFKMEGAIFEEMENGAPNDEEGEPYKVLFKDENQESPVGCRIG